MTTDELYTELINVTHFRENRLTFANRIIAQPELILKLLDILCMVDDKISCKSAWVLEFVCKDHLELLIPYLDIFTENMHKVHLDPAVRPVAKICEYLGKAYGSKEQNEIQTLLRSHHKEKIVEACFDWMITDEKIAPKAYAMNTLYIFGKESDWIHPELALILERDFQMQSSGFKARAKHILKKIKASTKTK